MLADLRNEAVFDHDVANGIETEARIDHAAAADYRLHAVTRALLMRNSNTAMRTNTPLWTCTT